MNKGVEILLARMESNPEEFMSTGKWDWVADKVYRTKHRTNDPHPSPLSFLTKEEVNALDAGYQKIMADRFTARVISTLVEEGIHVSHAEYLNTDTLTRQQIKAREILEEKLKQRLKNQAAYKHPVWSF